MIRIHSTPHYFTVGVGENDVAGVSLALHLNADWFARHVSVDWLSSFTESKNRMKPRRHRPTLFKREKPGAPHYRFCRGERIRDCLRFARERGSLLRRDVRAILLRELFPPLRIRVCNSQGLIEGLLGGIVALPSTGLL